MATKVNPSLITNPRGRIGIDNLDVAISVSPPEPKLPEMRFDYTLKPYNGMSYETLREQRNLLLSPSLATFTAFKEPVFFPSGKYQYLWDYKGKRHLDCLAQNLTIRYYI